MIATVLGVFLALYDTPILFPVGEKIPISNSQARTIVGSQVLAATVGPGINFQDLIEPVTIILRLRVPKGSVSSIFYYIIYIDPSHFSRQ